MSCDPSLERNLRGRPRTPTGNAHVARNAYEGGSREQLRALGRALREHRLQPAARTSELSQNEPLHPNPAMGDPITRGR